jgi:hypothetical protein
MNVGARYKRQETRDKKEGTRHKKQDGVNSIRAYIFFLAPFFSCALSLVSYLACSLFPLQVELMRQNKWFASNINPHIF